jgi:hypothetical protein
MTEPEYLNREEYVRIIATGYLALGKPVPEELWDEWEAILEAYLAAEEQRDKDLLRNIPDVGPLEVWAVCDGGDILLSAKGPASNGEIVMEATNVTVGGRVNHIELCKRHAFNMLGFGAGKKGELVCEMPIQMNALLVAGDTLTVTLNGADVANVLKLLNP